MFLTFSFSLASFWPCEVFLVTRFFYKVALLLSERVKSNSREHKAFKGRRSHTQTHWMENEFRTFHFSLRLYLYVRLSFFLSPSDFLSDLSSCQRGNKRENGVSKGKMEKNAAEVLEEEIPQVSFSAKFSHSLVCFSSLFVYCAVHTVYSRLYSLLRLLESPWE